MNRRHSDESYCISMQCMSPSTSLQTTKFPSFEENGVNSFSRCLYYENEVPVDKRFSFFNLEPNSSGASFEKPKSLKRS